VPPLTLTFSQPFIDIPRAIAQELFARMDEILKTLNALPRESTIWRSLLESWLVLRIRDWRFHYKIDAETERVIVMAAARNEVENAA
jgi:hypothetical protein